MRNIAVILVTLCASLRVAENIELKPNGIITDIGNAGKSISNSIKDTVTDVVEEVIPSCVFGVKSVSMVLYNRDYPFGVNIGWEEVGSDINIDPTKPVYFLVHGFISSPNYTNSYLLASALVEEDYTVFSLDWSDAACTEGLPVVKLVGYPSAVQNTREIGNLMANYTKSVIKNGNIPLKNITFIGHSLGAHVSGFAAKIIQKEGYGTIERLFACDPASPLFSLNACDNRLCKTDANYLMVLHTTKTLGITYDLGHTDYYFNGGGMQPGCGPDIACSHSRSTYYLYVLLGYTCKFPGAPYKQFKWPWEEVLNKPSYPGASTTDCTILDDKIFTIPYYTPKYGSYYVFVEKEDPYCTKKDFNCSS